MSKKNISKSAIEGGRANSNKIERRVSNQLERVNTRLAIATAQNDGEVLHDVLMPKRRPVFKEFSDKLSPVYRWLDSHLGEPWDKVRALLTTQFDTRTTAGRHVFYDHVLSVIKLPGDIRNYHLYSVDDKGLLQKDENSWRRRHYHTSEQLSARKKRQILDWMGNRRLGMAGTKLYWYVPNKNNNHKIVLSWGAPGNKYYNYWYLLPDMVYYWTEYKTAKYDKEGKIIPKSQTVELTQLYVPSYRQGEEFKNKDTAFFKSLPDWAQVNLLKTSPLNKEKKPKYYW